MGEKERESDDQRSLLQDEELDSLISQRARDHTLAQKLRWQKLHVAVLYLVIFFLGLSLAWSLLHVRVQDPFAEVYCAFIVPLSCSPCSTHNITQLLPTKR
jgi:hypothetical protein